MNLKNICREYDLEATNEFWNTPEEEIAYIYNGAGPDWMPAWGRKIITYFLEIFKGAIIIHDFDFDRSNKTRQGFDDANARMWRNFKKIINTEYPFHKFWLWYMRARYRVRARAAYKACKEFGWSAWEDE